MEVTCRHMGQTCVVEVGDEDTVGALKARVLEALQLDSMGHSRQLCLRTEGGKDVGADTLCTAETALEAGAVLDLCRTHAPVAAHTYCDPKCAGLPSMPQFCCISPCETSLLIGTNAGDMLYLYDLAATTLLWTRPFTAHNVDDGRCMAFSPCGAHIGYAQGGPDMVTVMATSSGEMVHTLDHATQTRQGGAHAEHADAVAFSPCGSYVVTAALSVLVWDLLSGACLMQHYVSPYGVRQVGVSGSSVCAVSMVAEGMPQTFTQIVTKYALGTWEQEKAPLRGHLSDCVRYMLHRKTHTLYDVDTGSKRTAPVDAVHVLNGLLASVNTHRKEVHYWSADTLMPLPCTARWEEEEEEDNRYRSPHYVLSASCICLHRGKSVVVCPLFFEGNA